MVATKPEIVVPKAGIDVSTRILEDLAPSRDTRVIVDPSVQQDARPPSITDDGPIEDAELPDKTP